MTRDLLDLMGDTGQAPRRIDADDQAPPATLKSEHVELDLVLHYDNEVKGTILVSETGHEAKAVWLPKSQIEFQRTGKSAPAFTTQGKPIQGGLPLLAVNCPEWLAKDRGFI